MIFKANIYLRRITEITVDMLKELGVSTLLLDVDNTLSTHHGTVLADGLIEWISKMQSAGIKLIVVSNSKKKRVKPFAEKIGLPFISLACKPLPFGYLKAIKKIKGQLKKSAIVGDQLFTDVWGAKRCGIYSVLVKPIDKKEEFQIVLKRYLERIVLHFYKKEEDLSN